MKNFKVNDFLLYEYTVGYILIIALRGRLLNNFSYRLIQIFDFSLESLNLFFSFDSNSCFIFKIQRCFLQLFLGFFEFGLNIIPFVNNSLKLIWNLHWNLHNESRTYIQSLICRISFKFNAFGLFSQFEIFDLKQFVARSLFFQSLCHFRKRLFKNSESRSTMQFTTTSFC